MLVLEIASFFASFAPTGAAINGTRQRITLMAGEFRVACICPPAGPLRTADADLRQGLTTHPTSAPVSPGP